MPATASTQQTIKRVFISHSVANSFSSTRVLASAVGASSVVGTDPHLNVGTAPAMRVGSDAGRSDYQPVIQVKTDDLARPVFARVDTSFGRVLLVDMATGIYGAGPTPRAAVDDFISALREHAAELADPIAPLNPEMKTHLVYLQAHLAS